MQGDEKLKLNGWKNSDNYEYYNNISIETLRSFAIKGGFENGCDIDLIYHLLQDTKTLLEVGAGYGRVVKKILARGYQGKLYALERSPNFYHYLCENFINQVDVIYDDIQIFQPNFTVDVILMLWGFIFDFPKLEQLELLRRIKSWLSPGGYIVLDTMPYNEFPPTATFLNHQTYVFCEGGIILGYATSNQEIDEYAQQLKIASVKHMPYITAAKKERILHILKV